MDTKYSWAAFIAIVGALYYYYSKNNQRGRSRGRSLLRANNTTTTRGGPVEWDDSESKQSSKSAKTKAPRKSVKKAVQEAGDKAEAYLSAASTAGADADDDLSPVVSPALGATTTVNSPSSKDVSDMLEPQGPAAGVLRISPSEKPARASQPQQQRPDTPQETKKQRQRQRKREEEKAQREADEKQRKILEEKQRRTAREARGEPAKNGVQPAKAPTSNPWTAGRPSTGVTPAQNSQLLDTFDPDVVSTTSSSEAGATNGTAPTPDSLGYSGEWATGLSEEEQLRLALEDSAWETVPKGKKQRKNKPTGDTTEEGTDTGASQEIAPAKKPLPEKVENKPPQSRFAVLQSEPISDATHPMDSDWPVV